MKTFAESFKESAARIGVTQNADGFYVFEPKKADIKSVEDAKKRIAHLEAYVVEMKKKQQCLITIHTVEGSCVDTAKVNTANHIADAESELAALHAQWNI